MFKPEDYAGPSGQSGAQPSQAVLPSTSNFVDLKQASLQPHSSLPTITKEEIAEGAAKYEVTHEMFGVNGAYGQTKVLAAFLTLLEPENVVHVPYLKILREKLLSGIQDKHILDLGFSPAHTHHVPVLRTMLGAKTFSGIGLSDKTPGMADAKVTFLKTEVVDFLTTCSRASNFDVYVMTALGEDFFEQQYGFRGHEIISIWGEAIHKALADNSLLIGCSAAPFEYLKTRYPDQYQDLIAASLPAEPTKKELDYHNVHQIMKMVVLQKIPSNNQD